MVVTTGLVVAAIMTTSTLTPNKEVQERVLSYLLEVWIHRHGEWPGAAVLAQRTLADGQICAIDVDNNKNYILCTCGVAMSYKESVRLPELVVSGHLSKIDIKRCTPGTTCSTPVVEEATRKSKDLRP
ncbi:hypothetical protein PROFUN_15539 [Planoprotostelium fungivorum]|uniref:Uncharacterized protein n=1 Tax=Planoprotostelium fungivorum TaxID=1890364 RepID=A0A2P6MUT5_9EUKA|nr:hypothetical protein PROFUN_15539 [Planoprotostelium fungivorum]